MDISQSHLNNIRDLAANYSDRQGLRVVPMALVIIAQSTPVFMHARIRGIELKGILLIAGLLAYFLIGRLYEKRFGHVEEIEGGGLSFPVQLLLFIVAFPVGITLDVMKHPPVFVSGLMISFWILLNAWPARTVRAQYLVIGLLLAAFCFFPFAVESTARTAQQFGELFGALFLCEGVAEHFRLVRLLGKRGVIDEEAAV